MTTQQDCSIQIAKEATYGVPVTTTRPYEFVSETFDHNPTFVQGAGLRVGSRAPRANRRKLGKSEVGGDLVIEGVTKGMGMLFNAALGASTATQIAAGPAWQQVHTPTTSDYLPSYTIQKGVPPLGGGATLPHTFAGMQCGALDLSISPGGILQVKTTWTGKSFDTSTAYAAPSYPAGVELFTFVDAKITIGGTLTLPTTTAVASVTGGVTTDVTDWSLTWDNKLDTGGFTMGGAGQRTRPAAVGLGAGTGKITAEFDATTLRDAFISQADLALVVTFATTATPITGTIYPTLQVVIPDIRLEGELPKSNAGAPVNQAISYTVLDNASAPSPLYIVGVTADTAL